MVSLEWQSRQPRSRFAIIVAGGCSVAARVFVGSTGGFVLAGLMA